MIVGQEMAIFKVNPDPDPHFGFLCEHGAWSESKLCHFSDIDQYIGQMVKIQSLFKQAKDFLGWMDSHQRFTAVFTAMMCPM